MVNIQNWKQCYNKKLFDKDHIKFVLMYSWVVTIGKLHVYIVDCKFLHHILQLNCRLQKTSMGFLPASMWNTKNVKTDPWILKSNFNVQRLVYKAKMKHATRFS
jgi:hypothetical protein